MNYPESRRKNRDKGRRFIWVAFGLTVPVILVAVFGWSGIRRAYESFVCKRSAIVTPANELKALAEAEENYYADNNTYADSLDKLSGYYTPNSTPCARYFETTVTIQRGDTKSWLATATRRDAVIVYTYDSDKGGLQ